MASKSTALAKADKNELAMFDTQENGLENVSRKDLLIPRLSILQALSPQIKKKSPDYIDGAEEGMICNTGTGDVFEEIHFVPCAFRTNYIEWLPGRAGLAEIHGSDPAIMNQTTRDENGANILPNGNIVVENAEWYVLLLNNGGQQAFMSLSLTQMKYSKKLMTSIMSEVLRRKDGTTFTPPLWYRTYKATAVETSKGDNYWSVWNFKADETILEADDSGKLLEQAQEFHRCVSAGDVTGDVSSDKASSDDEAM